MNVRELIEELKKLPEDEPVEAFGPNHEGRFVLRQVIKASLMTRRTVTRGVEGRVVVIETSVYDR